MIESQRAAPPAWRGILRPALILGAVAVLALILIRIPMTIEVFVVATLIAYGVNPLIRLLSKKLPRVLAIIVVYALFLLLLLIGATIVVPTVIEQLQNLYANSSQYLSAAQSFLDRQEGFVNKKFGGHMLPPQLKNLEDTAISRLTDFLQAALSRVGEFVVSIVNALIIGVTAIILSYYFLVNAYAIKASFLSLFPERAQASAQRFTREIGKVFGGFVAGQVILSTFCGVFTFLGLELIQSEYAVLLGVLTGLLYAIPYLGVFAAILVGFALGLLQSWKIAIWTAVIMFVVTKIADTLLVPKVMSESVGVSPMGIIFAVFAGGELFGLWGLILAIPVAALVKCVWIVWIHPWLTGRSVAAET